MEEQKDTHLTLCVDFAEHHQEANFLDHVITNVETWCYQYDPKAKCQSMEWSLSNSPRPKKPQDVKVQDQNNVDRLFWHQGYHPLWIYTWRDHCSSNILIGGAEKLIDAVRHKQEQWRDRSDSSQRQDGKFFTLSVSFWQEKPSPPLIIDHTLLTCLQLTSGCSQNSRVCWKERVSWPLRTLNHLWKKFWLTFLFRILKIIYNNGWSTGNIVMNWREIKKKLRKRTIPNEWSPHVSEVSANFCE
jgi:hypothetical protein